jgi:hypothetical protein
MEAEAAEKKLQQLQQDMELQASVCDMLKTSVALIPSGSTVPLLSSSQASIEQLFHQCSCAMQEGQQEAEACLKLAAKHMNECLAAQSVAGICEQKQQLARQKSQLLRSRSMNLSMRQQSDTPLVRGA